MIPLILFYHLITEAQLADEILITGSFNEGYRDFFNEIGHKYNLVFYYKIEWFESKQVNRDFTDVTLNRVLEDVLHDTPCTYFLILPNKIVFLPRDDVKTILDKSAIETASSDNLQILGKKEDIGKVKRPEITGTIVDGKNGEPIIGASVAVQNSSLGSTSNVEGKFILSLTPGIYNLIVSSIGYEQKNYTIKLIGNGELYVELFESSVKLDEVIVSAQRNDNNIRGNQISMIELDRKTIRQIPSLFGEKDIIRSLTTMPGVKTVGEFGSGIQVRGGGTDQNLFLLDGAPVFNTSHVFGLLSIFSPDAISNVSLYKGYIPPSFGERVSSVMDIHLKEGSFTKFHANGGIGLLDSRLMIESPIFNKKSSFVLGGRTSYSDWLLKKMPDIDLRNSSAHFYDIFGSFTAMPDPKNKTGFSVYASKDRFQYADEISYNYGNFLSSFYWYHQYSNHFSSKLILSHSRNHTARDVVDSEYEKKRISTGINYSSLKMDFTSDPLIFHNFVFGVQGIYYKLNPGIQEPLDNKSGIRYKELHPEQGLEMAVYLGDNYEPTRKISVQAGLRFSGYAFLGPNQINLYQPGSELSPSTYITSQYYESGSIITRHFNIEPRAAFRFQLGETNSFKASYNHNVQYLNLISYTSVSTPDDIWKLSNPYMLPTSCDQFAAGYFQNFRQNAIEASIEVYYKRLHNLVEYKNGARISMNDMLETSLIHAQGINYGIEWLVKKNVGSFDGWISYTYSRSLKQTTGEFNSEIINENRLYPSSYDKPHDLTLVGTYHYNKRLRFSCSFNHTTGRAVTLPEVRFKIGDKEYINFSERNKYRLPYYQRLDLSVSMDETLNLKKKWKGSWTFSIINVLARKNSYSVIYKEAEPNASNNYTRFGLYKLYIIGTPLPTLTYNFMF